MAENITPNLDLEKILATLAGLQQPPVNTNEQQQQPLAPHNVNNQFLPKQYAYTQSNPQHTTQDPRLLRQPAQVQSRPQERTSTPLIDPSTITEWKQGLRCVSKIAAQNPEFAAVVRKV